jgi:hypothetical protein
MMDTFNAQAIAAKIADHERLAAAGKAQHVEHSRAAGALLVDVAQNHPEHLDEVCKLAGIGHSRRYELMMIAGGRRTVGEIRAQNKAR